MLLETAVGKTFGTLVPRIDGRILFAIVVDMDTSEGFPKDRVSTAIFEEVIEMVLPLASKDCVLLADPKWVVCFGSMEFLGKEVEDTLE
jgi:hypothetical protein